MPLLFSQVGPGRINRGNELLAAKKARFMLVSGVGADVPVHDLISAQDLSQQMIDCCVTLGRAARDTRENAIESAGWAASHNISSIRLVTSDFHMPRSMLEFNRRLPHIRIVPEPVSSRNISLQHWWMRGGTAWFARGRILQISGRAHAGFPDATHQQGLARMRPVIFTILFYSWSTLAAVIVLPLLLGPRDLVLAFSRFWGSHVAVVAEGHGRRDP